MNTKTIAPHPTPGELAEQRHLVDPLDHVWEHLADENPDEAAVAGSIAALFPLVAALLAKAPTNVAPAPLSPTREAEIRPCRVEERGKQGCRMSARNDAPDFYQPGHTYTGKHGWKFRCDTVTTHPADGERTALGWRFFRGEWEPIAYHEDDWDIAKSDGRAATGGAK